MSPLHSPAHLRRAAIALPFCAALVLGNALATNPSDSGATHRAAAPEHALPVQPGVGNASPSRAVHQRSATADTDAQLNTSAPSTVPGRHAGADPLEHAARAIPSQHTAPVTENTHPTTPTNTTHPTTTRTRRTAHPNTNHPTTHASTRHRQTRHTSRAAPTKHSTSSSQIAYAVLSLLNSERSHHGLPALHMNTQLTSSAHAHNLAMAEHNQMSHQLPGEAAFTTRISRAGYGWQAAGENVGWNSEQTIGAATYLEQLMYDEGPGGGHYENIVSKKYKDIGVDVYLDAVHHKLWLTEDFGLRG